MTFVDRHCPYCGEPITLAIDDSAGSQQYIEDCQVCCRPIDVHVHVAVDDDGAGTAGGMQRDDGIDDADGIDGNVGDAADGARVRVRLRAENER